METNYCQFVQRCPECQIHGDLIHAPPSDLHVLTLSWSFSIWGIDIIGKISPKSFSGHEFILVAIDYFIKWVEAASYARLTFARVTNFIRSHIIYCYGFHMSWFHIKGYTFELRLTLCCKSMASDIIDLLHTSHRLMGAIKATNKNIKRILRKMVETGKRNSFLHCGHIVPLFIPL